jgi:hypothetical protein
MRKLSSYAQGGRFGTRIKATGGDIMAAKAFSRKQALFNEKAQQYARHGVISTPSYLRLETTAPNSATSTFAFNTLDTSGTKTATEKRLKLSDTFTITEIAFYLGTGSATSYAPTAAQYSTQSLNTFPNAQVASFTGGTIATDMLAVYNGFLELRIDSTTFIDSIPMMNFHRVGTSQQGVGSSATNNVPVQRNEWPLANYGHVQMLPSIELNGTSNIQWSINLPNATNVAGASGSFVNMVLVLFGFLNQGAATVQTELQRKLR